jgi:hypothetical protein
MTMTSSKSLPVVRKGRKSVHQSTGRTRQDRAAKVGGVRSGSGAKGTAQGDAANQTEFRYYDLKRNWKKVEPHLSNAHLNDVLVTEFNKYTFGRWGETFKHGEYPCDYESSDWRIFHKGPEPKFWRYVKHEACHWIVNFALVLAQLVEPKRQWRILTSNRHSTVWDGKHTLFEFNFQALGIPPNECFKLANKKELRPGQHLKTYLVWCPFMHEVNTREDEPGTKESPKGPNLPIVAGPSGSEGTAATSGA